jgi:hypothetical protein
LLVELERVPVLVVEAVSQRQVQLLLLFEVLTLLLEQQAEGHPQISQHFVLVLRQVVVHWSSLFLEVVLLLL